MWHIANVCVRASLARARAEKDTFCCIHNVRHVEHDRTLLDAMVLLFTGVAP